MQFGFKIYTRSTTQHPRFHEAPAAAHRQLDRER
jgi:hypothetical protein